MENAKNKNDENTPTALSSDLNCMNGELTDIVSSANIVA